MYEQYEGDNVKKGKINDVTNSSEDLPSKKDRRYNLWLAPDDFRTSKHYQTVSLKVIEMLEKDIEIKRELDKLYEEVCDLLIMGMNQVIPFKDVIIRYRKNTFQK